MTLFKKQILFAFAAFISISFIVCLPDPLFNDPCSDILFSSEGKLLNARISDDGQWRFPATDTLPLRFRESIIAFEDKRFACHPGVDPLAMARAARLNIRNRKISSGGSTITMQLIRLSRKNRKRTFGEKITEIFLALRLEFSYSKDEILALYGSYAPFGGNIIGIDAAAWRYFGHASSELSWAESALLAVLPNSPAMIHPGRNREKLTEKRNRLLLTLHKKGKIDAETYSLAIDEPVPEKPAPLPSHAFHLMNRNIAEGNRGKIGTTINYNMQLQAGYIAENYLSRYKHNHINNLAIIVANVKTGKILAYVGNGKPDGKSENGKMVDMICAERSPGSLLKPFLYASMLEDGMILPKSLMPDIPVYLKGFMPQNYNRKFQGVVPADEAIARSLNVPLVRMLLDYDYNRFYEKLKSLGMNTLHREASHYGASIILGGAEGSLINLTSMYAGMARVLQDDIYLTDHYRQLTYKDDVASSCYINDAPPLHKDAIWFAVEAMTKLNRHEEEAEWSSFSSMKQVAWKTGTSYGHRDAWAIGFTPDYIAGVWVGNASGEGRPGMTGVNYAAPVLFDILSLVPASEWFTMPVREMTDTEMCRATGFRAGEYCDEKETKRMPKNGVKVKICPYHKRIFLDPSGKYQATAECFPDSKLIRENRLSFPPVMEWYYRQCRAEYSPLPPLHPLCANDEGKIEIIYPLNGSRIYLPVGFSEKKESIVFKAAHSRKDASLYWYMNNRYIGETCDNHEIAFAPEEGRYKLTLTDERGLSKTIFINITDK